MFADLNIDTEKLKELTQQAARYEKVRRMDVVTFRDLSNQATTYEEFDAMVDAYEAV